MGRLSCCILDNPQAVMKRSLQGTDVKNKRGLPHHGRERVLVQKVRNGQAHVEHGRELQKAH
jgi:hypothetical protein